MTLSLIDESAPPDEEPVGLGAGQIRALKSALLSQFTGEVADPYNIPIIVGPRAINDIPNKADAADVTAVQAQADANSLAIAQINTVLVSLDARMDVLEASDFVTPSEVLGIAWPVGSIFVSYDGGTPTSKGFPGSWTQLPDAIVLLSSLTGFGGAGGAMSKILTEANMPAHRHFTMVDQVVSSGPDPLAGTSVNRKDSRGGGDLGYTASGQAAEPTVGRSSITGGSTAIDITPAHIKVGMYRRTA